MEPLAGDDPIKRAAIAFIGPTSTNQAATPGVSVSAFYHLFKTNHRGVGPTPRRMMRVLSENKLLVDQDKFSYETGHLIEVGNTLQEKHVYHMTCFNENHHAVPSGNNRMSLFVLEAAMRDCGRNLQGTSVYDLK
jgi:hypothetical protein